ASPEAKEAAVELNEADVDEEPPSGDPLREVIAAAEPEPERSPAEVKLEEAQEATAAGETGRAIELYRELLLEQPHDMELRTKLGMLYEARGQPDMAIEQYEAVRELDPENVGNLIRIANTLATMNR